MNILHFAPDEKFIPLQQKLFDEAFPDGNQWRVESWNGVLRHCSPATNLKAVSSAYYWSDEALDDARSCDLLVVHSMSQNHATGVLLCAPVIPVFWRGWGADYAHLLAESAQQVLLPESARVQRNVELADMLSRMMQPVSLLKAIGNALRRRMSRPLATLDSVAPLLDLYRVQEKDVDLVKRGLPGLRARYLDGPHYYTTEDVLDKGPDVMSGPSVLLGNSATATNNHIEALDMLKRILPKDDHGRRVIVPLNYGNPRYAKAIIRHGEAVLGKTFHSITEWMSLEEYQRNIRECGIVIMNHCRQQAYGNVASAVYKGAKVFMRPENSTYQRFRDMGVELFPIEILEEGEVAFSPLDEMTVRRNRMIVGDYLAREKSIAHIRRLASFLPDIKRLS